VLTLNDTWEFGWAFKGEALLILIRVIAITHKKKILMIPEYGWSGTCFDSMNNDKLIVRKDITRYATHEAFPLIKQSSFKFNIPEL
jgi:hypothetical protein